jgi:hypothetical protein
MAIKKQGTITRQDFEDAIASLRVSVAEIAKDTDIPRAYLSDLRNHGTTLRRDYAEKLRAHFEGKGIQFEDDAPTAIDDNPASPHPRLEAVMKPRIHFPIADTVSDETVRSAMDLMEENDARLVTLLKQTAERDDGFLGNGNFVKETEAALQETFALLAENYIVFRMLRGWRAFGVKPATEEPQTLRHVLHSTFGKKLSGAGLIEQAPAEEGSANDDEELAA